MKRLSCGCLSRGLLRSVALVFTCLASAVSRAEEAPLVVFDALCRAVQDNYPMLEYAGWNESWVTEFRGRVANAPDRASAFEAMDELVCRLNDYHTRLGWPERGPRVGPPFRARPVSLAGSGDPSIWREPRPPHVMPSVDGIGIAITEDDGQGPTRVGDLLVAVDGVPVMTALAKAWPHGVGSSVIGKLRSAVDRMLEGKPGSTVKLVVQRTDRGEREVAVEIVRSSRRSTAPNFTASECEGVPVFRISRMTSSDVADLVGEFDRWLDRVREQPAVIIDVRNNGGGSDDVASRLIGRFLRTPVISSISFHRQVGGTGFQRIVSYTEPRGPWRFAGRVVVLADEGSMSATEHFVSGMLEAGAFVCGGATNGACGLIRSVDLPGGAKLAVSRTFPLHTGGIPSPLIGMAPHRWIPPALADLRAGRDTALAAAIAWIRSGAAVGLRSQPMPSFAR